MENSTYVSQYMSYASQGIIYIHKWHRNLFNSNDKRTIYKDFAWSRSLLKDFALTLTSDLKKKLNSSESLHIFNLQKIKSEQNLFSQKKRILTSVCYDHDLWPENLT